ncbi:MAG: TRAP transporter small permease [Hyphomicrobiales bacterium]
MFSRTASAIERILDAVLLVALMVMVASIAYQVFGRYVLDHAPGWTEEVARFLMAWLTMLGSAVVIRSEGHIAVPVLADALPPTLREAVRWLRDTIIVTMAGALVWYGYGYALIGGRRSSPALEISMYWPGLAIPVGAAFIAFLLVLHRLSQMRGERR